MTEKRFTVHIDWYNYEKTEGVAELKDNGQPLLISESVDDVRYIKDLLNEQHEENQQQKKIIQELKDIIYSDEDQIIGEWSGNIGEDMEKLNKAYESDDINDLIKFCNGEC